VSAPEGFLTRWSRLKREAEEPAAESTPAVAEPGERPAAAAAAPSEPSVDTATRTGAAPSPDDAPAVDLAALPPIESITATTDIRPFLAAGVPASLARAALRRVWLADPAIRDFVGLAENAWDFTAPETVPGFGTLGSDMAQRLLAQALGEEEARTVASPERAEPVQNARLSATREEGAEPATSPPEPAPVDAEPEVANVVDPDAALHKEETAAAPVRRQARHGGALPRPYDE